MSNSKLLIINLPPGMQQHPSIFHANAYPPSYGFAPYPHHGGLPGYAPGIDPYSGNYPDIEKGEWMHPPGMFGTPDDAKIREVDEDPIEADYPHREERKNDALSTIEEAEEADKKEGPETLPPTSPNSLFERLSMPRANHVAYVERDDPDHPGTKKRFSLNEARLGDGSKRSSASSKVDGQAKAGYI